MSEYTEQAIDLIRSRAAAGLEKYGTDMDRRDLAPDEWVQHLAEELGDALQYTLRARDALELLDDAKDLLLLASRGRTLNQDAVDSWLRNYERQFGGVI